jgi:protein SCO1/2
MSVGMSRRQVVSRLIAASMPAVEMGSAAGRDEFGPVQPPTSPPSTRLISSEGKPAELARLLQGRITAVQLMFTGCSSTCPLQGAVFANTQELIAHSSADLQLLSISIDPLGDTPSSLRGWLASFAAKPSRWTGAVLTTADRDRLVDFLRGRATGLDSHATRVYLFDRQARLIYRTTELPTAERIANQLKRSA